MKQLWFYVQTISSMLTAFAQGGAIRDDGKAEPSTAISRVAMAGCTMHPGWMENEDDPFRFRLRACGHAGRCRGASRPPPWRCARAGGGHRSAAQPGELELAEEQSPHARTERPRRGRQPDPADGHAWRQPVPGNTLHAIGPEARLPVRRAVLQARRRLLLSLSTQ